VMLGSVDTIHKANYQRAKQGSAKPPMPAREYSAAQAFQNEAGAAISGGDFSSATYLARVAEGTKYTNTSVT